MSLAVVPYDAQDQLMTLPPQSGDNRHEIETERVLTWQVRAEERRRSVLAQAHQLGDAVVTSGGVAAVDGDRLSGEEGRVR